MTSESVPIIVHFVFFNFVFAFALLSLFHSLAWNEIKLKMGTEVAAKVVHRSLKSAFGIAIQLFIVYREKIPQYKTNDKNRLLHPNLCKRCACCTRTHTLIPAHVHCVEYKSMLADFGCCLSVQRPKFEAIYSSASLPFSLCRNLSISGTFVQFLFYGQINLRLLSEKCNVQL